MPIMCELLDLVPRALSATSRFFWQSPHYGEVFRDVAYNGDMPDLLYQPIADDLRAKIRSGQLSPGERLKSQGELSAEYTKVLSRPVPVSVIRAAAAILVGDGLVEIRQGRGTFVVAAATLPQPVGSPVVDSTGKPPPASNKDAFCADDPPSHGNHKAQARQARAARPGIWRWGVWPWNWDLQTSGMFSFAGMQPYLWLDFFSSQRGPVIGTVMTVVSVLIVVHAIGLLLVVGESLPVNLLGLAYAFSALTYFFSTLYWGYGGTSNFSISLTRLDAIYFSVGTLTTAGTGNISATSELSRGLQTTQMALDFVLVVFVLAIVIPRFIRPAERLAEPDKPGPGLSME
jgi:DNA-binding transcriptional regulator YhcF (GntR family)